MMQRRTYSTNGLEKNERGNFIAGSLRKFCGRVGAHQVGGCGAEKDFAVRSAHVDAVDFGVAAGSAVEGGAVESADGLHAAAMVTQFRSSTG